MGPEVNTLTRISPSQYGRLLSCPYRTLLERSPEGKAILAQPGKGGGAAGAMGNIVHKVLEAANRGKVQTVASFDLFWQQELVAQEAKLIAEGRSQLVPLAYRARGYAVTKLLLKCLLLNGDIPWPPVVPEPGLPLGPEQTLTDSSNTIRGQVDLVRRGPTGRLEIVDYKTGRIFHFNAADEEAPEVKREFVWQLRLYAALLHERTGQWPERLLVVDLAGGEHPVSFTQDQCLELLAATRSLLTEINVAVDRSEAESLARPAAETCGNCKMQQLCEPHAHWMSMEDET